MDYIYNGELQIFQENLDRFLVVAQRLKLKGLIENIPKPRQEKVKTLSFNEKYIETEKEENESKLEEMNEEAVTTVDVSNMDMQDNKDRINEFLLEGDDKSYKCSFCGKISYKNPKGNQKFRMQRHIETHLEGLSYTCPICQKEFRSSTTLSNHKSKHHR